MKLFHRINECDRLKTGINITHGTTIPITLERGRPPQRVDTIAVYLAHERLGFVSLYIHIPQVTRRKTWFLFKIRSYRSEKEVIFSELWKRPEVFKHPTKET